MTIIAQEVLGLFWLNFVHTMVKDKQAWDWEKKRELWSREETALEEAVGCA